MRYRIKGTYPIDRKTYATMLAMIIDADPEWEPYMIDSRCDLSWTLDRGNDWHLHFTNDESRMCEVTFRYKESHFGLELFAYIAKRMGWEPVE